MLDSISRFADSLRDEIDDVVLFGMGGSSLAPEVLRQTFDVDSFHVLDTTHPKAIRRLEEQIDLDRTLFVASSKSGTTLETRSHLEYFWEKTGGKLPGHFAAITDPGSDLETPRAGARVRRGLLRRAVDRRPLLGALAVRDRAGGADGHRREGAARARAADARGVPLRQRQPRLRARPRLRRRLERRPRQDLHRRHAGRLRPVGRAAHRGVDREARQGARPRSRRVARRRATARPRRPRSPTRSRSARSSSAGSSRSRSPARISRSIRSTSPTSRRRRTRRTRCSRPARTRSSRREGSVEELLAQVKEGDYVCVQAFVDPTTDLTPLVDRLRRESGCVVTHGYGPRYLHSTGPAPQGRPEHRPLPPGRRRRGRGARDPRQAVRLPAAHPRAGRGRLRVAQGARPARRAHQTRRISRMQLGMVGLGRMGANMTERLTRGGSRAQDVRPERRVDGEVARGARAAARRAALRLAHGAGGNRRLDPRRARAASRRGRHDRRRRQLVLRRRPPPPGRAARRRRSTTSTRA